MTRRLLLVLSIVVLPLWPTGAAAQSTTRAVVDPAADPPAHVAVVDGAAVLERDGQTDSAPANMPLLAGDRLRTDAGRVEILFADGATLHLDAHTTLDFQSDDLVRLLDGRVRLMVPGPNRRVFYRVDAPAASIELVQPGDYRIAVLHGSRGDEVELAVLRGAADLVNDGGRTSLRPGERALARVDGAASTIYAFNSASWDAFDRWSEARRSERLGVSAQYLPSEVRPYTASFDTYGSWRYEASYGYVWYPTVAVGWRPYYNGRWSAVGPYGWTWIGADPWAWPTHHYGRWGISAGVWFWIPGATWGPAWVSWAYSPGYVSWCPLGWNNRPAVHFYSVATYGHGYNPWHAWTVVPSRHFGPHPVPVRGMAVPGNTLAERGNFVGRAAPPAVVGNRAVPRTTPTPITRAGSIDATRASGSRSIVYTNLGPGESRVRGDQTRVIVGGRPAAPAAESRPAATSGTADRRAPSAAGAGAGRTAAAPDATSYQRRAPWAGERADSVPPSSRAIGRNATAPSQAGVPARLPQTSTPGAYTRPTVDPTRTYRTDSPATPAPDRPYATPRAYGEDRPRGAEMPRTDAPPPRPSGAERRAPSGPAGPPPSAAPDSGSQSAPSGHSRSGGQAQGAAVPRRGGR